jgi:hypothetical protein
VGCSNQPPLDITGLIKPKLNSNVVLAVPNIFTLQDCLRSDHRVNINKQSNVVVNNLAAFPDSLLYSTSQPAAPVASFKIPFGLPQNFGKNEKCVANQISKKLLTFSRTDFNLNFQRLS